MIAYYMSQSSLPAKCYGKPTCGNEIGQDCKKRAGTTALHTNWQSTLHMEFVAIVSLTKEASLVSQETQKNHSLSFWRAAEYVTQASGSSHSCKAGRPVKSQNWSPLGELFPCQEPEVSPWNRTPESEPPGHRSLCSPSYCFHFELAIPSLFLSEEASPTPTYFRTSVHFQVSFFVVLLLRSISLQVFQSSFEDAQRHKYTPFGLYFWLFQGGGWEQDVCCVPVSTGPLHQQVLALAWECTEACNGTTDWPRADNLQGPRHNRFPFLHCTCFITVTL